MTDALLAFLYGTLAGMFLLMAGLTQNKAIQPIIIAETKQHDQRFVVLCQASKNDRVRCTIKIEEQAP